MAGKAVAETGETQPIKPKIGFLQGPFSVLAAERQPERDVVARRLPGQQRVVLKQHADLGARQFRVDKTGERLLQANDRAQETGFSGTGGTDQADKLAFGDVEACARENGFIAAI